ncbi:TrkH family potassium uptake protein [Rhodobacteraceae bacterium NNCM2]|nr:TrkH family potassium uptake protein [Coraliihabitans acroporae]
MIDFRPVGFVIGRLVFFLGLSMLVPMLVDLFEGDANWRAFGLSGFLTMLSGAALSIMTRRSNTGGLSRPQAFLLTTLVWVALPLWGSIPFMLGAPFSSFADAYFEGMSGFTTTGATVFEGLDEAPKSMLLWRALLQWYGGVGIVVVAMVFLPTLKIGGMQFFQSESFYVAEDILPRAVGVAQSVSWIYVVLTAGCMIAYGASGMSAFDAVCHAMTTVSTGGLANYDSSFEHFDAAAHYAGSLFMILAALPFIKFVQLANGRTGPLLRDSQVRGFLTIILVVTTVIVAWMVSEDDRPFEPAFREALFNVTSIITGTGFSSDDFTQWGGLPVTLLFTVAMIGGCAGSTSCSAKVFRYQILLAALEVQIRRIHSPSGVFHLRYDNRPVDAEILSSVMGFFFVFFASFGVLAVLLSMVGLDTVTAISGSVAILTNMGPGLGHIIGPAGNYASLPDSAKWLMSAGMLFGRLEFLSVLVLFTPSFWSR